MSVLTKLFRRKSTTKVAAKEPALRPIIRLDPEPVTVPGAQDNAGDTIRTTAPATYADLPGTTLAPGEGIEGPGTATQEIGTLTKAAAPGKSEDHWKKTNFFCATYLHPILQEANYGEMWGIMLQPYDIGHVPTQIVAGKFLSACNYNHEKAAEMLKDSLIWRSQKNPRALMDRQHARKFERLGYTTTHPRPDGGRVVVTWNLWTNKRDSQAQKEVTMDINEYLDWRIALMELEIDQLGIGSYTALPQHGSQDPFRLIQVHDFSDFKFANKNLFSNTKVIAAGLKVFSANYPDMVSQKEFVGMPFAVHLLMRGLKAVAPDAFANARTVKKASSLARKYLPEIVGGYPYEYNTGATAIRMSTLSVYQGRTTLYHTGEKAQSSAAAMVPARKTCAAGQAASPNEHVQAAQPGDKSLAPANSPQNTPVGSHSVSQLASEHRTQHAPGASVQPFPANVSPLVPVAGGSGRPSSETIPL